MAFLTVADHRYLVKMMRTEETESGSSVKALPSVFVCMISGGESSGFYTQYSSVDVFFPHEFSACFFPLM